MHPVISPSPTTTQRRILIASDQGDIDESVRLALAFHLGPAGGSSAAIAKQVVTEAPTLLSQLEIVRCGSDYELVAEVEKAASERRSFGLLVVDAGLLRDKNPKALLLRLWHFQRDLPVLLHAASHVANYEHLSDELGGATRLLLMRLRLLPFEMSQLISLIIGRKMSDPATVQRDHDLSSQLFDMTRRLEDASAKLKVEHDKRVQLEEKLARVHRLETVGRLADGVAHFFNNQLTALQGHLGIALSERDGSPRLLASLEELQAIARRAADITSLLIAFNHREFREPVPVNLVNAVEAEAVLIKHVLGADIALEIALGTKLPLVLVDSACLGQILLNLVVVASDGMPSGGKLSIHTHRHKVEDDSVHAKGDYIALVVSGQGQGLDMELQTEQDNMQPSRLHRSGQPESKEAPEAGLPLVQSLVRRVGGWMDVKTVVGVGAEFSIYLPVAEGDRVEEAGPSASPHSHGSDKATILIVDDEDAVSQVMEYVLTSQGHKVLVARDANEAWQLWLSKRSVIKLAIVDVQLPGGSSGFDLEKALHDEDPLLPVVFICGYTASSLRGRTNLVPGENFLPKPFGMTELLKVVGKALLREARL